MSIQVGLFSLPVGTPDTDSHTQHNCLLEGHIDDISGDTVGGVVLTLTQWRVCGV